MCESRGFPPFDSNRIEISTFNVLFLYFFVQLYYRGSNMWAAGSPGTQSLWAMPGSGDVTPGSIPEEAMIAAHAREPEVDDGRFATFGKRTGRRALAELERMRLQQLEQEAQEK